MFVREIERGEENVKTRTTRVCRRKRERGRNVKTRTTRVCLKQFWITELAQGGNSKEREGKEYKDKNNTCLSEK